MNEKELRDYFAAAALPGLLASPNREGSLSDYARDAYQFADALLEERRRDEH